MTFSKLYKIFFLISVISFFTAFLYPVVFAKSDIAAWQGFSVFVALCVICFWIAAITFFIHKNSNNEDSCSESSELQNADKKSSLIYLLSAITVIVIVLILMNYID